MTEIIAVGAREILDSRGNPTVEVDVELMGARLVGRPFRRGPPPVSTKRSSSATETPAAI